MACFRLVTLVPLFPLLRVPRLRRRMALSTLLLAAVLYLRVLLRLVAPFRLAAICLILDEQRRQSSRTFFRSEVPRLIRRAPAKSASPAAAAIIAALPGLSATSV